MMMGKRLHCLERVWPFLPLILVPRGMAYKCLDREVFFMFMVMWAGQSAFHLPQGGSKQLIIGKGGRCSGASVKYAPYLVN